ncbi:hypothetical protein BaRGS_00003803, partial [Batillaria attramentaria]
KVPSDATFFGAQYLSYNLSSRGDALVSNRDQVSLDFRTKQPNGLLFYTGNAKDYLNIAIRDGGIVLTINLGSGTYEDEVLPAQSRFDDNRWHHIMVRREAREISLEVDGIHRRTGSTTGKFTLLSSKILYVAGSPDPASLLGSRVRSNFKGCMRKVRYRADSVQLDLTELARSEHPLMRVSGEVIYDKCQELTESRPITFTTSQSYLTIPTWDRSLNRGSLAFQFQTVEQNGVVMYSTGMSAGNSDFFALELLDGYLHLVLKQGLEPIRLKASNQPVSDGQPHNVYFEYQGHQGYITVDGQKQMFTSLSRLDRFDLDGSLCIGGINKNLEHETSLPKEIWAGMLGYGFVGCLEDMIVNGNKIDLMTAAQIQGVAGLAEYCQVMEPHCLSHPCMHQGVCVEGWNRFTCDCRATGFIDFVCQTAAATMQFDGTQFVKVTMPEESHTQAEDISLRFRTMHPNGLLFMTTSDESKDKMELYLEGGIIYLGADVGSGEKKLSVGHMLHDDRWHTVYIKRRAQTVELKIDQLRPVTDLLPGQEATLSIKAFYIGYHAVAKSYPAEMSRRAAELEIRRVDIGNVLQDDNKVGKFSGFIGSMQQFIFNRNLFFEMARTGKLENIQLTAQLSSEGFNVLDPVTFKSTHAYAVLPRLQAHDKFSVSFQLKTTESDGLLMFNAGLGQDFFAMELTDGFLYYIYNMGAGTQRIRANVNEKLNDNRWHEVRLLRTETYKQLLRVDDNTPTVDDLSGADAIHFDLQGYLYLGGVQKTMYHTLPKKIEARYGFVGCIGSLDLNGYLPNILREASPVHESVGDGCQGPTSQCQNTSCANGGRCVQQWNSISCDCDMTSYTGPRCEDEGTTYRFGPGRGLITFTHPSGNLPSTNRENLALGFKTKLADAVLVRIDSATFDDYIELELVKGNVYAVYNMGTRDYPIGELFERVNDGRYHVVRFTRSGPNSTIQVDNLMMQTKMPRGQQAHTFNNQAFIYIGGKKDKNGTFVRPFEGTMSGLVLNGMKILELARKGDERVTINGSVTLLTKGSPSKELAEARRRKKRKLSDTGHQLYHGHPQSKFYWANSSLDDKGDDSDWEGEIIGNGFLDEEDVETTSQKPTNEYRCAFSGNGGKIISVDQDDEGEDEPVGLREPGSGWDENDDSDETDLSLGNMSATSGKLTLLTGNDAKGEKQEITTVILPFMVPEGATMSNLLHVTVTSEGSHVDWEHTTTSLEGVTDDDIIISGAGPECPPTVDDSDCSLVGSGTTEDIFNPTMLIKKTSTPPTTTTKKADDNIPCKGDDCQPKTGEQRTEDFFMSTPEQPSNEEISVKPTGDPNKTLGSDGGNGLNIGLIIGIAASVLVAVVILCIALYKFRSAMRLRDDALEVSASTWDQIIMGHLTDTGQDRQ